MAPFLRKVTTASGATAVQIVEKIDRKNKVIEHLGSAHSDGELAVLMEVGRQKLRAGQGELDLGLDGHTVTAPAVVSGSSSRLLTTTIRGAFNVLGFDRVDDEAFFQLVLARIVEPTSMVDSGRVLRDIGLSPVHLSTMKRALGRCASRDYRDLVATACFTYSSVNTGLSLLLYDVTTLYFEAEKEDDLRKVGYSKERRVDPQVVVGLLVDRSGFPLEIHCFEGNTAETHTIIPVIAAFQQRHNIADMVVVADAGMLSKTNLEALEDAGLRFIVGSRLTKAPEDLAHHFHWHGDYAEDQQIVDTHTPRHGKHTATRLAHRVEPSWDPHDDASAGSWRAIWQHRTKRAVRDRMTLKLQKERALKVIDGDKAVKSTRFVKTTGSTRSFDEKAWQRAESLAGWKGYVTNIPVTLMPAPEVIASYHELWHVEQSFRMSKTDLAARPMFHRTRDAIEAHLTIVFTALAVSRYLYTHTGVTTKRLVKLLRPLQDVTITINGHSITAVPHIPTETQEILNTLHKLVGH